MKKREDRRDRTWRAARQAQLGHLGKVHGDRTGATVDCACERSVWFFEKVGVQRHRCGKSRKGSPKMGYGACRRLEVRPVVEQRRRWRKEVHRWRVEAQPDL